MQYFCDQNIWSVCLVVKKLIQEAAKHIVKWLNAFPPKGGISTEYSPRIIMGYTPIDYNKHCKLSFGRYCQVVHQSDPTNTPKPRTIGAIYLGPTDNIQGGHKVMNLATGKVITRHHATDIPITKDVVDRINQISNLRTDLEISYQIIQMML